MINFKPSEIQEVIIFSSDDNKTEIKTKICCDELKKIEKTSIASQNALASMEQLYDAHKSKLHLGLDVLTSRVSENLGQLLSPDFSTPERIAVINKITSILQQPHQPQPESLIIQARQLQTELSIYNQKIEGIKKAIDQLEKVLDVSQKDPKKIDQWITEQGSYLNGSVFDTLSFSEGLHLCSLLQKAQKTAPAINVLEFTQHIPEQFSIFRKALLSRNDTAFIPAVTDVFKNDPEKRSCAIAHYINHHRIPISELTKLMADQELADLTPYLHYGDFRNCSDELVEKLLENCSNLYQLFINNSKIKTLPSLPACLMLDCNDCTALQQIHSLPACETLYCNSCTALQQIHSLPACETLYCDDCTALQQIHSLPACEWLSCDRCTALQQIPSLPACLRLYCNDCTALQQIPSLPACETLYCDRCTALQQIPSLPACEWLYCDDCTALQQIPSLPACQTLYCNGCTALQQLPELPATAQVYSENSPQTAFHKLNVDVAKFETAPKELVLALGEQFLLKKLPFPNIYYFENGQPSQAVDVGGVRRDFVVRLLEHLFLPDREGETGNMFFTMKNEIPQFDDNPKTKEAYRTLGRLFFLCLPEDSYFKTGPLFSDEFYKMLALYSPENQADSMNVFYAHQRGWPASVVEFLTTGKIPEQKDDDLINALYYTIVPDVGIEEFYQDLLKDPTRSREEVLKIIGKEVGEDRGFQALSVIGEEVKSAQGDAGWNTLAKQGGVALKERIEGVLTADEILSKLEWQRMGNLKTEDFERTKGFIKNWILERKDNRKELELFVRAVSSNKTLCKKNLKMEIYERDRELIPIAHTCYFSMEIPGTYPNQEHFNTKIGLLLTEGLSGTGFQFA